jgi:Tol biopolymer transport system component
MKRWRLAVILVLTIVLVLSTSSFWKPYLEIYNGKLAVIGMSQSGDTGIYFLYPYINYLKPQTPSNMTPFFMAWSPNGKTIAFIYSILSPEREGGIALLNAENGQIDKVYIFPHDEKTYYNLLAWTPDGQSIWFDTYKDGHLLGFQKLDVRTLTKTSVEVPEKMLGWTRISSFALSVQGKLVAETNGYVYVVSKDMKKIDLLSTGTDLFLTPDGNELTFFCHREQWSLCNIDLGDNQPTGSPIRGEFVGGIGTNANWSWDKQYLVYLKVAGESDPHSILMLNTKNGKTYNLYKGLWSDRIIINQIAWHSKK